MLNNNTINLGCLPNSSFSFAGDRESENWFAIHSNMCVAPQRIELGINKRELRVEKITPAFHHESKHRIDHKAFSFQETEQEYSLLWWREVSYRDKWSCSRALSDWLPISMSSVFREYGVSNPSTVSATHRSLCLREL